MVEKLANEIYEDFGKDILADSVKHNTVHAHRYGGTWEDIAMIRSFYETNLALNPS